MPRRALPRLTQRQFLCNLQCCWRIRAATRMECIRIHTRLVVQCFGKQLQLCLGKWLDQKHSMSFVWQSCIYLLQNIYMSPTDNAESLELKTPLPSSVVAGEPLADMAVCIMSSSVSLVIKWHWYILKSYLQELILDQPAPLFKFPLTHGFINLSWNCHLLCFVDLRTRHQSGHSTHCVLGEENLCLRLQTYPSYVELILSITM